MEVKRLHLIKYILEHHLRVFDRTSFQGSSSRGKFKVEMKRRPLTAIILFLFLDRMMLDSIDA